MPAEAWLRRRGLAAGVLMLSAHCVAWAAEQKAPEAAPEGTFYVMPRVPEDQSAPRRMPGTPAPALQLPGTDWRGAAHEEGIRHWGDAADLGGDALAAQLYAPPRSPAELASDGVHFGQSSLVNSGPATRHGVGAVKQVAGLAKGMGLQFAQGQLFGWFADLLDDK